MRATVMLATRSEDTRQGRITQNSERKYITGDGIAPRENRKTDELLRQSGDAKRGVGVCGGRQAIFIEGTVLATCDGVDRRTCRVSREG